MPTVCDGHAVAMRAGDLLLFSGLVAADAQGLVERARIDPRQPYYGSSIEAQMEYLLAVADAVCRQAGTSLANVVRIQQMHTDLAEFYPACQRLWSAIIESPRRTCISSQTVCIACRAMHHWTTTLPAATIVRHDAFVSGGCFGYDGCTALASSPRAVGEYPAGASE
jgi:enamine deaminase RidA (YjgF/YER057c/UK114 family)